MGSSRKSKPGKTDLVSHVAGIIGDIVKPGDRLVVALSGGIDSVTLLDILLRISGKLRFRLAAIHVNHQLSPNASRWAAFCRELCRSRDVPLRVARVQVPRGNSVEAAARAARHDVFRGLRADYVVLGHNQDDQAETVLLQLLRGAGVKGLAAMPVVRKDEGGRSKEEGGRRKAILRPLLNVPRSEIERYARARRLKWVEDESNAESQFQRNFLRREVLPVIARRFPAYRSTLARAARNFAEAGQLLDDLARSDGAGYGGEEGLEVAVLRGLTRARAKNLLRRFMASHGVRMPNSERLEEALRQAVMASDDARVCVDLGDCDVRRFAGALYLAPKLVPVPIRFRRPWNGERELELSELGGVLILARHRGAGIDAAKLRKAPVTIRVRQGGERLQPDCNRPRRSLKNLFQEAGVPPWRRARLPLLYCGETLVWVPGIGVDCAFQARRDGLLPVWRNFA
jgi:tRNA(Ile)-lysidine synthase